MVLSRDPMGQGINNHDIDLYTPEYSELSTTKIDYLNMVHGTTSTNVGLVTITRTVILGAVSIRKTVLPGMAIPMLKIRRPNGRLIFNMEITICR